MPTIVQWQLHQPRFSFNADTVIAQDAQSNMVLYTRADILRKEESQEVLKFVGYWKQVNGTVEQTLVFDCKFTKYEVLDELDNDNVKEK
ncbi:MAG: hypothetical protein B6D64_05650 [Bacteroidetes bacterium 4484_276]|nr:MAG: hypothetical protein B6D64_05650 [Bacteroidetes bacterium 4484_276]